MCGSNLGINDLAAICKIGELCNKYGMDTISFGGTIGFVMEAFEKGAITQEDTFGEAVRFGDAKAVVALCEKTARREGFGDLLAEGTKRVAEKMPPEAAQYAVHVKGKEMPAHTPHAKSSFALAYSLVPYGPDHCSREGDGMIGNDPVSEAALNFGLDQASDTTDMNFEKVKLFRITQILYSIVDSMPICLFIFGTWTVFPFEYLVDYINACTGWKLSFYELLKIGERRINIMTAFNTLGGSNDKDNVLPAKFFEQMDDYGVLAKSKIDEDAWRQGKQDYYALNCWTRDGIPSVVKMKELGLGWVLEKDTEGYFGKTT
jgi:aldehyde:ferredoxin oxidoreductase